MIDECLNVLDCVIRGIKEISLGCISADKVIVSSILNTLLCIFYLNVN